MANGTETITTLHFALMALLAVAVIFAIAWGVKLKRARVQGRKEFEAHAEEAGVAIDQPEEAAPDVPPAPTPVPVAPAPPPVADARPPVADAPVVATPPAPVPVAPIVGEARDEEPHSDALANALADAPIAAVIVPDGTGAAIAADLAADDAPPPGDGPLTDIKGLGPRVAAKLGDLGIDRVGQLAALDPAAAADLDARMGAFTGRMTRDRWIEQARLLAAGDRAGFEAAFGKLG